MRKYSVKLSFDRLIYGGSFRQITVLLCAVIGVFFLIGGIFILFFSKNIGHYEGAGSDIEHFWQLYYYFADPGNQMSMNGHANGSRIIGMIMSTLGSIFLGGLLISTITNIIERRVEECRGGHNYYKFNDHVVIIGSDQMVLGIVKQMCETDVKRIVVMTSRNVEQLRNSIHAILPDKKKRHKVIVNYGTRDSANFFQKVNITSAREVYILGDDSEFDDIESYHDSLNVECLHKIAQLCKEKGRRGLPCNVSFDYKTTYHVFQYADLSEEITEYVNFQPFNFYEFWAQKVLVANMSPAQDISYKPLDWRPITSPDSDEYVHLIVIGMSHMGQAIALQAAHIAHFPNWRHRKTRITIIDRNMRQEMDEFKQKCGELFEVSQSTLIDADHWVETGENMPEESHINETEYGHLVTDSNDRDFIDIEWTFIKGDDGNPKVRQLLKEYVDDKNAIVTVAVCLNITHRSLRSAMHLPKAFYEKGIPVLVQQRKTAAITETLNGKGHNDKLLYQHLRPFGMVSDCYDIQLVQSMRFCMRINAAYDYYYNHRIAPVEIDDASADVLWAKVKTSKRWSNIFAAASIPTKLRCIGYDTTNLLSGMLRLKELTDPQIQMLAEMEHNRWNVEELLLGYRPVTKEEDAAIDADKSKKGYYKARYIHYDIRPFDGLKKDISGETASAYDVMIVRCLPLIVNPNQ